MKNLKIISLICLTLILTNCEKIVVDTKLQAAQDLVKGDWVITEISDQYLKIMENKENYGTKGSVKDLKKEQILGSIYKFPACDASKVTKVSPCYGTALFATKDCGVFYNNDPNTGVLEMSTLVKSAPGIAYSNIELEIINAFSGMFTVEKKGADLKIVLKENIYGKTSAVDAYIILSKK